MATWLPLQENFFTQLILPLLEQKTSEWQMLTVSLWAEFIPAIQVGKVNQIAPLQVKPWNGAKNLSSTPGSLLTEVSHQAKLNDIPLTNGMPDSNEIATTVLTGASINSVDSVETYIHCINCGRCMAHATSAKFIQYQRCGVHMKTESVCEHGTLLRTIGKSHVNRQNFVTRFKRFATTKSLQ